jgi:chromosome segregation ATPase
MHLSSITIKGFKSFPERTRLVFSPGVSVIVGPNGCGKSNITDAVLWALGEQSPLAVRGQTMQDMIFAGGEGESPRRYAEVEVVLDNSDGAAGSSEFSEISIRRRLDRHGEGEYRLNGARCRLVDVIEALADANLGREMHSVISQGRVEEIVHSRPRDRRLLVEEAAGLGKHRKRRRRAQLKLERTRDNLDRALDVEREARTRLRPLRRQAQAADIHARLEREAGELRATLLADELRAHSGELDEAERDAEDARRVREAVERELATVNARRSAIEERLAERDRERTAAWGRLTAVRAAHERLSVRAEAISGRRAELAAELDRRRAASGAMGASGGGNDTEGADSVDSGLDRVEGALEEAGSALTRAREAPGAGERAAEVARVRGASERAARTARRVEGLLGPRQDPLDPGIGAMAELMDRLDALLRATVEVRDAVGERAEALERGTRDENDTEGVAAGLRACSEAEAELQGRLHAAADSLTEAEVRAAQLRDRRAEVVGELEAIARRLGREIEPAAQVLSAEDREEIERKLERLRRRREALGPVNPLAEQEYSQSLEHVRQLEEQRQDLEGALAELEGLIRDTDRKIRAAFEETFEATQRNFEELIQHLFPGGRGRLRLVGEPGPRLVLGGGQPSAEGDAGAEPSSPEATGSGVEDEDPAGIEIEVTPAGKATRRLSLLSGGEKALVALAFVFAVFLARPSPFYILDEVEAALDDANIDRFLQLVRRFAGRAQFVIVTHQKRTMDAADVLYGVSMGKGGISKVVSRRLSQDAEAPDATGAAEAA